MQGKLIAYLCICACIVLAFVPFTLAIYETQCEGLNCSIRTKLGLYTFTKHGSLLQLTDSKGNIIPNTTSIGIGFSHLVERHKNFTTGINKPWKCYASQYPWTNDTSKTGEYASELVNYIDLAAQETTLERKVNFPHEGITSLIYTYYWKGAPALIQTFAISDRPYTFILSNDTRYTGGTVPTSRYTYVWSIDASSRVTWRNRCSRARLSLLPSSSSIVISSI